MDVWDKDKLCKDCRFFNKYPADHLTPDRGTCHWAPPGETWPVVFKRDSCNEFKPVIPTP